MACLKNLSKIAVVASLSLTSMFVGSQAAAQSNDSYVGNVYVSNLVTPMGIEFNSNGDLFIGIDNSDGDKILKVSAGTKIANDYYNVASHIYNPYVLKINSSGNLVVTGGPPYKDVYEITDVNTKTNYGSQYRGYYIYPAPNGETFARKQGENIVYKLSPNGLSFDVYKDTFGVITDLIVDSSGNVYVSQGEDEKVLKIDNAKNIVDFVIGLSQPIGLELDADENLYVADQSASKIYKVSPNGTKTVYVNNAGYPLMLAFDNNGNLFYTDMVAQAVKKVELAPAAVPTMTEWAMILFGLGLAGGAVLVVQRRRALI